MQTLFALTVGFVLGAMFYMYMYNRHTHKRRTYSRIKGEGFSYTSRSGEEGESSDSVISQMEFLYKRDGKVVVEFIGDDSIHLTTLGSLENELVEEKLSDIKSLIRDSI